MNSQTFLLLFLLHNLFYAEIFQLNDMFLPSNTYLLTIITRSAIKVIEVINHKNYLVYLESFLQIDSAMSERNAPATRSHYIVNAEYEASRIYVLLRNRKTLCNYY